MGGDQFLRLREAYLPNLSLLIWISHLVFIYSLWIGLGAVPWVGRGGVSMDPTEALKGT